MPLQIIDHSSEDSICAIWHICEPLSFFMPYLDAHVDAGFDKVHHPEKQLQWLANRFLTKTLVEQYLNQPFLGIFNDNYGKPWLLNSPWHMSMSNTLGVAAVVLSNSNPVGIDIEIIKPKIERIAGKFLTEQEIKLTGNDENLLTQAWCIKETVYKIHGKKNISLKDHIRIDSLALDCSRTHLLVDSHQQFQLKSIQFEKYMMVYSIDEGVKYKEANKNFK